MTTDQRPLYTIGHSTHSLADLIAILHAWGVSRLIDVRSIPRSRTNPQFNADILPVTISPRIVYTRIAALGGFRRKGVNEKSANAGWNLAAFRNYADYAETDSFRAGLKQLLDFASNEACAIMCAEAVWWRCHRRIVTDHVLARGVPVIHLFTPTKAEPASLTSFAQVECDCHVSYPKSTSQLELKL